MSLRHALLGLLNDKPASGYDLMRTFDTTLAHTWPATQSQVYGELNRLTEAGLLCVSAEGPRGRKEYSITDSGRAELVHWLADTEPNRVRRNETLLRIFFLGNLTRDQAVGYLEQEAEVISRRDERFREIERTADWEADDLAVHGRLALEYGLRLDAMHREWTDWAVAQLNARDAARRPAGSGQNSAS
ncbi:PadR family transcriptional regulator [Streptacidiphilus sp. PB12-B1b]|uniref:PadR family transcriptional regulator n=1 Tax=Streptacidiphilus sp. PB12-B1b TaxID=2705012 RepID=UPI0015FE12F0|nr:PadR family transcriptional regulator [Streptacidiphilus sp. PB12-B1b]QMU78753.1 PadR family transcriptional regulator [Streptacidiphilus sp. PB12-B1b]